MSPPTRPRSVRLVAAVVLLALAALPACDKLKSALGKDGDASAAASGSGAGGDAPGGGAAGGVLSFLGSDFEGEIAMKLTSRTSTQRSGPQQIVFGMKKPKYRLDMTGGAQTNADPGSFILDLPTKKGYMLVHSRKMAMVVDLEKMKNGQAIPGMPRAPNAAPSQPPKVEKTGKKDVVAGYTCEIWNVTSEGKRSEVCAAEGITWVDLGDLGMSSPELVVAAVTTEANRFPLRVIAYDAKGVEEMRMEATKVEKKKLDDARFAVPPGYQVVDMSAFMGGIPGMPSGIPNLKPPR